MALFIRSARSQDFAQDFAQPANRAALARPVFSCLQIDAAPKILIG
jgi:hypothetical protein